MKDQCSILSRLSKGIWMCLLPLILLALSNSRFKPSGDNIVRSVMDKLANDRIKKVSIVGIKEADQSLYAQLISGKVIASGLDEELAKEATRADKIVTALHAGAECAGIPISNCVLVPGSQSGVAGAIM